MVKALYASTMEEDAPCWTLETSPLAYRNDHPSLVKDEHLNLPVPRSYMKMNVYDRHTVDSPKAL